MAQTKRKPKRRKSNTSGVPVVEKGSGSSIRIRKIENGIVVSISKDTGKRWVEKEYFAKSEAEVKQIVTKAL